MSLNIFDDWIVFLKLKALKAANTLLAGRLTTVEGTLSDVDTAPTDGSTKLVTSGGVYAADEAIRTEVATNTANIATVTETANTANTTANALTDRVENIIAQSGSSDTEVVSARTNTVSGVTYLTLAARADAEYTEFKEDLSELSETVNGLAGGVPTPVRQALNTLARAAYYEDVDVTAELATVAAWAAYTSAIVLDQSAITISGASTVQLTATTTPAGNTVSWTSSNEAVATVSSSGFVTGVDNGTATITATSGDISATCEATVSGFATVTGISAAYTQSGTVYESDSLDSLTSDLVVTATYSDSSTRTLTGYTLSGTLTAGTSTITVSYGGFTTTFTVTVTAGTAIDGSSLTWESGYINESGEIEINPNASDIFTSEYFETGDATTYELVHTDATVLRMAFFDSSNTLISRVLTATGDIPEGSIYARATVRDDAITTETYDGSLTTIVLV